MNFNSIGLRLFLKTTGVATALLGMTGKLSLASTAVADISNPIPCWRGFNLADYFRPIAPKGKSSSATTLDYFRRISDQGFNFVWIQMINAPNASFDLKNKVTPGRCAEQQ